MMTRPKSLTQRFGSRLTIRNVGIAFAVASIAVIIIGYIVEIGRFEAVPLLRSLWANVGTELASIAITVLLIDKLIQRRDVEMDRARLVRDFRSEVRDAALRAVEELRAQGWLYDGSLQYADLSRCNLDSVDLSKVDLADADLSLASLQRANLSLANLQGADLNSADMTSASLHGADLRETNLVLTNLRNANLSSANLQGAALLNSDLQGANLKEANLCEAQLQMAQHLSYKQLVTACALRGASMTDGSRYDGRYNLDGDLLEAIRDGVDPNSAVAMARYYGVSLIDYQHGQEWARENLPSSGDNCA